MKNLEYYKDYLDGYLNAITDIDGGQREFYANTKMMVSENQDMILDIQVLYSHLENLEVIKRKRCKNFYSLSHLLEKILLIKPFGEEVSVETLNSYRDYVIFHITDYVDFAFDDADWHLGKNKELELFHLKDDKSNMIILAMSDTQGQKLFFTFYRECSDSDFIAWVDEIIEWAKKREKALRLERKKARGINYVREEIIQFIAGRRDRDDMREIADTILVSGDASSQAIIDIYINHDLELEKMALLLHQGLSELGLLYMDTPQKATLYLINSVSYQMILKNISYYDGFCEMKKIVQEYNELHNIDDYFGESLSPILAELLHAFDLDEDIISGTHSHKKLSGEEVLNQEYEDSPIDETLKDLCDETIYTDGREDTSFMSKEKINMLLDYLDEQKESIDNIKEEQKPIDDVREESVFVALKRRLGLFLIKRGEALL